ncbi:helicase [Cenarchaeum symbiosum A]|uniref:Helicase n=1 Tax=Cenarchaeum symbiosum (strain A) TaxID=414004 RepID=A0RWK2_CENSY|nr:helicase [Cenarchaeum symbiosum A]
MTAAGENAEQFRLLIRDLHSQVTPQTAGRIGAEFERLTQYFLLHDRRYADKFSYVELWDEWRRKPGPDKGVDIVAGAGGEVWAIKCKFYDDNTKITARDILEFFEGVVIMLEYIPDKKVKLVLSTTALALADDVKKMLVDYEVETITRDIFETSRDVDWQKKRP